MKVVLASASPRRRALLRDLKLDFTVLPSNAPERPPEPGEDPATYARALALAKARAVARICPGDAVLGSDTVVAVASRILGKPQSHQDAVEMLELLRGKTHLVVTGVAMLCGGQERVDARNARVTMRAYGQAEILDYVATGEPMDKAGAYAVQGRGGALVERVEGCYTAVVGLPLCLTAALLRACNVEVEQDPERLCRHGG